MYPTRQNIDVWFWQSVFLAALSIPTCFFVYFCFMTILFVQHITRVKRNFFLQNPLLPCGIELHTEHSKQYKLFPLLLWPDRSNSNEQTYIVSTFSWNKKYFEGASSPCIKIKLVAVTYRFYLSNIQPIIYFANWPIPAFTSCATRHPDSIFAEPE